MATGTSENGLEVGDSVGTPDGKYATIIEIQPNRINYHRNDYEFCDASVVLLDNGQYWLDIQLVGVIRNV